LVHFSVGRLLNFDMVIKSNIKNLQANS
jgi:hypothetical protein